MDRLAKAVQLAAEIRENSWHVRKGMNLLTDDHGEYSKTLQEAADEAASAVGFDERGSQPVYLLLKLCWNDALEWASLFTD